MLYLCIFTEKPLYMPYMSTKLYLYIENNIKTFLLIKCKNMFWPSLFLGFFSAHFIILLYVGAVLNFWTVCDWGLWTWFNNISRTFTYLFFLNVWLRLDMTHNWICVTYLNWVEFLNLTWLCYILMALWCITSDLILHSELKIICKFCNRKLLIQSSIKVYG